jgi:hypothetical protein
MSAGQSGEIWLYPSLKNEHGQVVMTLMQIVKAQVETTTCLYGLANCEADGRVTSRNIEKAMQTSPAMARITGTVIATQERP